MRISKEWLCALVAAFGCAVPVQGFCDELQGDGTADSRMSVVRLATNNSWDTEQATTSQQAPPAPVETPAPAPAAAQAPAGCCSLPCDDVCCDPVYSLIANVEATFFWPQFHRDFLTSTVANPNGVQTVETSSTLGSTDGSLLVGPRITLGVQGCKWGFVGRYWNASNWVTGFTPSNPAVPTAGITSFDGFKAYTFDLEVQRRFFAGDWQLYGFGGARHASVNNDRSLNVTSFGGLPAAAGDTASTSFASQQFNGTGITFGLWGLRPIGCCDSPFKFYFANRYSFLWGTGDAVSQTSATAGLAATSTNGAAASGDGTLFVGELQLGIQWDAQLRCLPGRAFVRTGLEYQYWDSNPGLNTTATSVAIATAAATDANASAGDILFSMIGFNIGAGIMY